MSSPLVYWAKSILFSALLAICGCGGGTYGTGGGSDVKLRIIDSTGRPSSRYDFVLVAGIPNRSPVDSSGSARVQLVEALPISLLRATSEDGSKVQDFYFRTDPALAAGDIILREDTSFNDTKTPTDEGAHSSVKIPGASEIEDLQPACDEIISSWQVLESEQFVGFSSDQEERILAIISDPAPSCQEKKVSLAQSAFSE